MNNAELFEAIFGIYATELWAMEEPEFLQWLNAKAPEFKVRLRPMTNSEILQRLEEGA